MHCGGHFAMLSVLIVSYTDTTMTKIHSNKVTPITLKVASYPYIPDSANDQFKSLLEFIKKQFEAAYPDVNLELRPMNTDDDFYDLPTLTQWLASNGTGYDVVEVDTELLGDLVNAGLIVPQLATPDNHSDWHPAAAAAVEFNRALYGYPHFMCSFFLFTRDDEVAKVATIDQLSNALGNMSSEYYRLVGNLDSSWDLPSQWIGSYQRSSDPGFDVTAFALHSYRNASFESIHKLARLCDRVGGENHCLDGTFKKDYELPGQLFAQRQAKAMFDYSERLFSVLKNGTPDDYYNIKVIPLPTGTRQNQPVFFTDAYVFRQNMSSNVLNAARAFSEFMATPRMQAAVLGSGDSPYPDTIPRYLLSMSKGAYDQPLLIRDRFYQEFFRQLTGFSFPTTGVYNTRKDLQAAILKNIK